MVHNAKTKNYEKDIDTINLLITRHHLYSV